MGKALLDYPISHGVLTPIRNSVRALIIRNNHVLLLRKHGSDGTVRFAMPGGGQDAGERLHETLVRECVEELGARIEIVGLVHVAEAFKRVGGKTAGYRQQVEFIFRCRIAPDYLPRNGLKPDRRQVAVEWVGLQHMDGIDLRPAGMATLIGRAACGDGPVYCGGL